NTKQGNKLRCFCQIERRSENSRQSKPNEECDPGGKRVQRGVPKYHVLSERNAFVPQMEAFRKHADARDNDRFVSAIEEECEENESVRETDSELGSREYE